MSATIVACFAIFAGGALLVGGVYTLWGSGWAMLVAATPFWLLAAVLFRGLRT